MHVDQDLKDMWNQVQMPKTRQRNSKETKEWKRRSNRIIERSNVAHLTNSVCSFLILILTEVELEEKLHAAGHLSDNQYRAGHLEKSRLMQAQIKLAAGQKLLSQAERRAKRRRYPQKLTNVHMLGQYEWFNAPGKAGAQATASQPTAAPAAASSATQK